MLSRTVASRSLLLTVSGFRHTHFFQHPQLLVPLSKTPVLHGGHTNVRQFFHRTQGSVLEALRFWKLLEYLGFSYCKIVRFRRGLRRFAYPWLSYCIPAALILATGDLIAQYHLAPHAENRTIGQFFKNDWKYKETLAFFLLGIFPVGVLLSKWNLFWYRKLKCNKTLPFIFKKLALDILILAPILLSLMALVYGYFFGKVDLLKEKYDCIKTEIKDRFYPSVKDAVIFNAATRPPALIGIFYLIPKHLKKLLKGVYEIIFATKISDSFRKHIKNDYKPQEKPETSKSKPVVSKGRVRKTAHKETAAGKIGTPLHSDQECEASPKVVEMDETPSRWTTYKRWACRNRGE